VQRRGSPRLQGPVHSYLREGVERFGFNRAVDVIIALLHTSVLLFTAGFLDFLFNLNTVVARIILGLVVTVLAAYLILTTSPVIYSDCPYSTPLSPVIQVCVEAFARGRDPSQTIYIMKLILGRYCSAGAVVRGLSSNITLGAVANMRFQHAARKSRGIAGHVFQQMFSSLDDNDEIYEMLLTLPAYVSSLSRVGFDQKMEILPLMEDGNRNSLGKLLGSFHSQVNPDLILTPHHVQQLTQVMLLANATGVRYGRLDITVEPVSTPTATACLSNDAVSWYSLSMDTNPTVSFVSLCLLSSLYLVVRESCAIDEANMDGRPIAWLPDSPHRQWFTDDCLLSALKPLPPPYRNVYRLLFFIRQILHYCALPDMPAPSLQYIWSPILQGLHNLTFEADLRMLPDNARATIWRTIAVVGREDLLPHSARGGLPADASRLFEEYPVLGGTLRSVIATVLAPGGMVDASSMDQRVVAFPLATLPLRPLTVRAVSRHRLASTPTITLDAEYHLERKANSGALEFNERPDASIAEAPAESEHASTGVVPV
jgi:hypothetical protein